MLTVDLPTSWRQGDGKILAFHICKQVPIHVQVNLDNDAPSIGHGVEGAC